MGDQSTGYGEMAGVRQLGDEKGRLPIQMEAAGAGQVMSPTAVG